MYLEHKRDQREDAARKATLNGIDSKEKNGIDNKAFEAANVVSSSEPTAVKVDPPVLHTTSALGVENASFCQEQDDCSRL